MICVYVCRKSVVGSLLLSEREHRAVPGSRCRRRRRREWVINKHCRLMNKASECRRHVKIQTASALIELVLRNIYSSEKFLLDDESRTSVKHDNGEIIYERTETSTENDYRSILAFLLCVLLHRRRRRLLVRGCEQRGK